MPGGAVNPIRRPIACLPAGLLALCLSLVLFAQQAHAAAAAHVEIVAGTVTATNGSGAARPLAKGSEVNTDDLIDTGSGRVQLHFADGAHMVLGPGSRFHIDQYRYNGRPDGQEKGFFSLLSGSLRTISGLIGKSRPEAYKMTTSAATIGIRGTEYSIQIGNDVQVWVEEGAIDLTNGSGTVTVNAGQTARIPGPDAPPQVTVGSEPANTKSPRIQPCPS